MKKILILHTGGTIAMSEDKNGAVAPGKENPLNSCESTVEGIGFNRGMNSSLGKSIHLML